MNFTYYLVFKNNLEIDRLDTKKACLAKYPKRGHTFKRFFRIPKDFVTCPYTVGYTNLACNPKGEIVDLVNGKLYKPVTKRDGELYIKEKYDPLLVKSVVIRTINPEKVEKDYIESIDGDPLNVSRENLRWAYNGVNNNDKSKKGSKTR